jgi:hypothetical protein
VKNAIKMSTNSKETVPEVLLKSLLDADFIACTIVE